MPEPLTRRLVAASRYIARQATDFFWWRGRAGRRHRDALAALAGKHAGRRCFVLGNGPSLLNTDVRRLRDEVTIASNGIFLLFEQMGYEPSYLTCEDPLVAEDRATELNSVGGSTKLFPRDLSYCLLESPNTIYVNFVRNYRDFPRFSERFDQCCYWGGTVSMMNLQLAYHLGCNPIYLVGFDHSYKVPDRLEHVMVSQADDVNHFHPDYFGKGYRWHDPRVDKMEQGYRAARRFLDARGVRVFNATAGGRLEVFERIDYARVLDG